LNVRRKGAKVVMPAEAGIQTRTPWMPACAGMMATAKANRVLVSFALFAALPPV
jgi:hypothetical protein